MGECWQIRAANCNLDFTQTIFTLAGSWLRYRAVFDTRSASKPQLAGCTARLRFDTDRLLERNFDTTEECIFGYETLVACHDLPMYVRHCSVTKAEPTANDLTWSRPSTANRAHQGYDMRDSISAGSWVSLRSGTAKGMRSESMAKLYRMTTFGSIQYVRTWWASLQTGASTRMIVRVVRLWQFGRHCQPDRNAEVLALAGRDKYDLVPQKNRLRDLSRHGGQFQVTSAIAA